MKITNCVPMPGQGLIARSGDLIVLTDGLGGDPDPLLTVLAEVVAAGGDGSALVRGAARAALAYEDRPAWACVGVTNDGDLAVLVHGAAAADISVDGGGTMTLTGHSSLLPMSQLVAGGTVVAGITLSGPTDADARLRLDGGIVRGGGAVVTVTADASSPPARTQDSGPPLTWAADSGSTHTGTADADRAAVTLVADPSMLPKESGTGALEPVPPDTDGDAHLEGPEQVLVDGVLCARQHFNDPNVRYCRQCGIGMAQPTRKVERRPRPPLGVLLLDDGSGFTLDTDYVIGREPMLDAEVAAGRARALRITDPDGTVSRLHLRVSLVGWQVEVSDLGSANGSVLHPAAGPEARLKPHDPVIIEPGTRVAVGRRSFEFLSHRSG